MSSRIAKLLNVVRAVFNDAKVTDVEVDLGGGDNITAQHFSAPGDDSHPLKTDYVLTSDVARNGSKAAHGYIDPINANITLEGDKRIYGRDPADGSIVNQVWLQNDGDILASNDECAFLISKDGTLLFLNGDVTFTVSSDGSITGDTFNGKFKLENSGIMDINGATIDPSGNIFTPGSIVSTNVIAAPSILGNTKELAGHTHPAGTPPGNTGVNN